MVTRFLSLEWRAFFRSASLGKSLGLRILMVFLALYFAAVFLIFGIGLYPLLQEFFPGQDPLQLVNRFVLLWLVLELGMRFMLQTLPVMDIKPLMLLPIPKRKVVNFVLIKSLYSFYNFLPLFIIIPFGLFNIYKNEYPVSSILGWMLAMIALSLCVNFSNFIIKKRFTDNLKALIPIILVIVLLAALEYFQVFEISLYFGRLLDYVVAMPYLAVIPVVVLVVLYKWNQQNLESKFYLDAGLKGNKITNDTRDFQWTRKLGSIAPFLQLDLKLIWRNKRPKTTIYMSLLLVGYGLFFYPNDVYHDWDSFYVFIGIFMTGIFMINFGQFVPSWDASYYPMIMSQNIPLKQYLASKAGLISFSVVVLAILTTPYVYFGWNILMINMVCAVYNIGVNIPILLYAGSFNKKRIDLDKSPFMNYQGTGATQWLVSLPLMALPVLLYWFTDKFFGMETALGLLSFLGIAGLLLRPVLLNSIAKRYQERKYAMINGFKETGE
ncbi:MAG TPA: DUF5687 family protein [Salegentibacter sp.]|uniref:DUF5687 family protein n=1 Tax=Salegentibacter sp. TaxID=1903072 RepID=UPI002F91DE5C